MYIKFYTENWESIFDVVLVKIWSLLTISNSIFLYSDVPHLKFTKEITTKNIVIRISYTPRKYWFYVVGVHFIETLWRWFFFLHSIIYCLKPFHTDSYQFEIIERYIIMMKLVLERKLIAEVKWVREVNMFVVVTSYSSLICFLRSDLLCQLSYVFLTLERI